MSSSLVRWYGRTDAGNGRKLFWDRAGVDGLPFRGSHAPMLPEEEMEQRIVRVADYRNAFFDLKNEVDNKNFNDVMECCLNGWFRLVWIERFWNHTTQHYLEWAEYYLEDGKRTPFSSPGIMELSNGSQNYFGGP